MKVSWKPTRKAAIRTVAVLGVAAIAFVAVFSFRACQPGAPLVEGRAFAATLEPAQADATGVAPDSSFTLSLEQPVSLSAIRSTLTVEPPVDVAVKAADKSGKVYSVTPERSLEPDRVYRFSLALAGPTEPGFSWAFQVKSPFRVTRALPGNTSSGVPLNSAIEIEFSHEGATDPAGFFSLAPFVPGTWERHRRTLVYVPRVALQPATFYTCTVKKGLGLEGSPETLAEDYVFSFETVEAAGGAVRPDFYFWMDTGLVSAFAPTEVPFFTIGYGRYGQDDAPLPKIAVAVYRYRDAARFVAGLQEREEVPFWAYLTRQNWKPTTVGLDRVVEVELEPQQVDYQGYLGLPETLPVGYYLISFKLPPYEAYAWTQITDLSSYLVEADNDTVVWFNSLASGKPVRDVVVRSMSGGAPLGTSASDGVARFATPAEAITHDESKPASGPVPPYYILGQAPDDSEAILDLSPLWNPYDAEWRKADSFWSYLYTDRPLYLPNDEVRFWGVVQPREGGQEVTRVRLELRSGYSCWDGPFGQDGGGADSDATLILAKEVEVRRSTFDGRLTLPNLPPDYYYVQLIVDGVVLTTQGLNVATYTKPAYRLDLVTNKRAVFAGEKVEFGVTAAFFEGTPASELRLKYDLNGAVSESGTLLTDVSGRASLTRTAQGGSDPFILENSCYLQLYAELPESGPIYTGASVRVFEKDVCLRGDAKRLEGGQVQIEVALNKVALDLLNAAEAPRYYGYGYRDYLGEPVAGREVKGQVEEIVWEARERGQYYDFIEKVVKKTYDYTEVRVPQASFTLTTDQAGLATWTFNPQADKSYRVRLTSTDEKGRAIGQELWVYGSSCTDPRYSWYNYNLVAADRDTPKYKLGETVSVVARNGQADLPSRESGYLFVTARQGLETVEVGSGPTYGLTFEERYIPSIEVLGVYFDGRYYNSLGSLLATFDYADRKLDITVNTDKESYGPGDTAVIGVEVRDTQGRPVGAEVNLSLVDEALFQLGGQSADPLAGLYGRMLYGYILQTRGSHYQRGHGGAGAESGEGGEMRRSFLDCALFESLTTGSDGRGTVEVTLPDNLTSWRLTYQAFASNVRAGGGTKAIPVRLPFFVEVAANETYLSGDEPVIQARAYGTALPSGTAVSFSAKLAQLKADGTTEPRDLAAATGKAFKPANITLGALQRGTYELRITGRATLPDGTKAEDGLARKFEVVDTYLRLDRVDYYEVTENLRVAVEPGELATLTFCDAGRGNYLGMLWRLVGGGSRADMKAAAIIAHRLLVEDFGYDAAALTPPPSESGLLACQVDGGVALLPYAGVDLELTAKVAALGGVGFDEEGLLRYLGGVYDAADTSRERFAVALYGLAAMDQPVLLDLERLASEPDLSVKEKLYTSLGLIELGSEEKGRELFDEVLKVYGDRVGSLLRLKVSRDQEEIIAATSLAAVIAAELKLDDKDAFLGYLVDNEPWEELNLLEVARFLQVALPLAPSTEVAFTLQPGGTNVKLKPGETYTCLRMAGDLANLAFSDLQGKVGVCVSYRASADLADTRVGSGEATLSRGYSTAGKATKTFDAGDVVRVTLTYKITAQALEGTYQVVDFLPSGLKAVPRPADIGMDDGKVTWPAEIDGQKIRFNVFLGREVDPKTGQPLPRGTSGTLTYYARIVSLGSFAAEPAVLVHAKTGEIFAVTDKDAIVIR